MLYGTVIHSEVSGAVGLIELERADLGPGAPPVRLHVERPRRSLPPPGLRVWGDKNHVYLGSVRMYDRVGYLRLREVSK